MRGGAPASLRQPLLWPASGHATVVAMLDPANFTAGSLDGMGRGADILEVTGPGGPEVEALRSSFAGELAYSEAPGAAYGLDRFARLSQAALRYDYVDLHWPADVSCALLDRVPAERRWITYRGSVERAGGLAALVDAMVAVRAALIRVCVEIEHEVPAVMGELAGLGHLNVTAFGCTPGTAWSRILAPWLGAPVVFGRSTANPDLWGVPDDRGLTSVRHLTGCYGLPELGPLEAVFGIFCEPGATSLSPQLHNAAYRRLGLPALYLPFATRDFPGLLEQIARAVPDLLGATVVSPFKERALDLACAASAMASSSGGANLLIGQPGGWKAHTTDSSGVVDVLAGASIDPWGWPAAVVGCGGAGRAAAATLLRLGARVTLVNRGPERGLLAARLLNREVVPLAGFDPQPFKLIVHATPVCCEPPFNLGRLSEDAVILEMVYGREPTALAAGAREKGWLTIDGWDVLMAEVREQFRLMTGRSLPEGLAVALVEACRSGECP